MFMRFLPLSFVILFSITGWAQKPARKPINVQIQVPALEGVTEEEVAEYMGALIVLKLHAENWKEGDEDELVDTFPWLDADEKLGKKWEKLVKDYQYKILPFDTTRLKDKNAPVNGTVDHKNRIIYLNLEKPTYGLDDPSFALVRMILDADLQTKILDRTKTPSPYSPDFQNAINDFFGQEKNAELRAKYITAVRDPNVKGQEQSNAKISETIQRRIIPVWSHRRALTYQAQWYPLAKKMNPLVTRPQHDKQLQFFKENYPKFRQNEIDFLVKRIGEEHRALVESAWDYELPEALQK